MTKQELIHQLRDLANMLEQTKGECACSPSLFIHALPGEEDDLAKARLAIFARALSRMQGKTSKNVGEDVFWLMHDGADALAVTVFADRDAVCRRVVTGMVEVPAAEAYLVPEKPAHTVERVEWICDGVILAPMAEEQAVQS